jgi:hypothetical protein
MASHGEWLYFSNNGRFMLTERYLPETNLKRAEHTLYQLPSFKEIWRKEGCSPRRYRWS